MKRDWQLGWPAGAKEVNRAEGLSEFLLEEPAIPLRRAQEQRIDLALEDSFCAARFPKYFDRKKLADFERLPHQLPLVAAKPLAKAAPDADGWIAWEGYKEPPFVPEGAVIYVRLREGREFFSTRAATWYWDARGNAGDIIAYRIVQPAPAAKPADDPMLWRSVVNEPPPDEGPWETLYIGHSRTIVPRRWLGDVWSVWMNDLSDPDGYKPSHVNGSILYRPIRPTWAKGE